MPERICSGVSKVNSFGEICKLLGTVVKFVPGLGGMMGCEQWQKQQGESDYFSKP